MLESYAVGVTVTMSGNVTSAADRMLAAMERLDKASKQVQGTVTSIVAAFQGMRSAASSIDSLTRAVERLGRSGAAGGNGRGGGRSGGRPGNPSSNEPGNGWNQAARDAYANAVAENRNVDQIARHQRDNAALQNRLLDAEQDHIRKLAALENRAFDQQMRSAQQRYDIAYVEANRENRDRDTRSRDAERAKQRRYDADYALANRENRDRDTRARSAAERRFNSHDAGMVGMGLQAVGSGAGRVYEGAFDRAVEVAHLRTQILADQRVTPAMADKMVSSAYDATQSAPGTKVAENLHALIDLKNVTGDLDEAEKMLPRFARLSALLSVMDKRRGGDGSFAAAKALEIMGGMIDEKTGPSGETVREINPELMQKRLDYMARVSVATNARVAPQDYLGFAKQARVAGMTLSDEFVYEKLPAMMMGMGGSRAGTALMSMAQVFEGGKLTAKSMEALQDIGLAGGGGVTFDRDRTTGKRREVVHPEAIYDLDLMRHDPLEWVKAAQGRMEAHNIHGSENQIVALMKASQRTTIAGFLADLLKDMPAIEKEQKNITSTKPDVAAHFAAMDPAAKMQQLQAAFDKLMTVLGTKGMDDAIKVIDATTAGLNRLAQWAEEHPTIARVLVDTAAGLTAVGTALGVLSTAVFLFAPAMKLLGLGGGAVGLAEKATESATGGLLSRYGPAAATAALRGATGLGPAAILGGLYEAHQQMVPLTEGQMQRHAPWLATPNDGYDASGRPVAPPPAPINLTLNLSAEGKLDGMTLVRFVASQLARTIAMPSSGTTGYDLRIAPSGGLGGAGQ